MPVKHLSKAIKMSRLYKDSVLSENLGNEFDISANNAKPLQIVLTAPNPNNPNLTIRKILTFSNDDYVIKTRWEVNQNITNKIQAYYQLQRDNQKPDSDILMSSTFTGPAIYTDAEKYQKIDT